MAAQGLSKATLTRLNREQLDLARNPDAHFTARPVEGDLLTWHFVLRGFPPDSPYHGGCYHGRLTLPPEYPLKPPSLFVSTPNGRFVVEEALCVSMTAYHAEQWNPAWTIRSILLGFLSFWLDDADGGKGALVRSPEERRCLAEQSWEANARSPAFRSLFPELLSPAAPGGGGDPARAAAAAAAEGGAVEPEPVADVQVFDMAAGDSQDEARGGGRGRQPWRLGRRQQAALEAPLLPPDGGVEQVPAAPRELHGEAEDRIALELAMAESHREDVPAELATAERGGPAASVGAARERTEEGAEDAEDVCWICHDRESPEPLLQPCACRGSMSGVHASCIESWVRHHARSSPNSGPPRCPVCRQAYLGRSEVPGLGSFLCRMLALAARAAAQLALLISYAAAVQRLQDGACPGWLCALLAAPIAVFCAIFLAKVLVLTASLPRFHPPPCRQLQYFVVTDPRLLELYLAEVVMALYLMLRVAPLGAVPLAVASALPVARCLQRQLRIDPRCLKLFATLVLFFGAVVALVVLFQTFDPDLLRVVCLVLLGCWLCICVAILLICVIKNIHPLNAGPHILVAIAVSLLSFFAPRQWEALAVVFVLNSLFLAAGLLEKVFRKKLRWRQNPVWMMSLYAAGVAWVICLPSKDLVRVGRIVLFASSTTWLVLLVVLAAAVNWDTCIGQPFRNWQRRHMAFRLDPAQAPAAVEP